MTKNILIGVVCALAIAIVFLIIPKEEEPVAPKGEDPVTPEQEAEIVIDPEQEDLPIMQLTEEELIRLQEAFEEVIPEEMQMAAEEDPDLLESLLLLDEKIMELSLEELKALTADDIERMFEEVQETN